MEIIRTAAGNEGNVLVLSLSGEFDKMAVEDFTFAVSEAIAGGSCWVVMDLNGVRFMDSSAVQCVLRAEEQLLKSGGGIVAARPRSMVDKVFRLLEFSKRIRVFGELEEAVGSLAD